MKDVQVGQKVVYGVSTASSRNTKLRTRTATVVEVKGDRYLLDSWTTVHASDQVASKAELQFHKDFAVLE